MADFEFGAGGRAESDRPRRTKVGSGAFKKMLGGSLGCGVAALMLMGLIVAGCAGVVIFGMNSGKRGGTGNADIATTKPAPETPLQKLEKSGRQRVSPPQVREGSWVQFANPTAFKVVQVVDNENAIVKYGAALYWVEANTRGWVDDSLIQFT